MPDNKITELFEKFAREHPRMVKEMAMVEFSRKMKRLLNQGKSEDEALDIIAQGNPPTKQRMAKANYIVMLLQAEGKIGVTDLMSKARDIAHEWDRAVREKDNDTIAEFEGMYERAVDMILGGGGKTC